MPSPLARLTRIPLALVAAPVRLGAHVARTAADMRHERPRKHHPVLAVVLLVCGLATAALVHPFIASAGEPQPAAVVPALAPGTEPRVVDLIDEVDGSSGSTATPLTTLEAPLARAAIETTRDTVAAARLRSGKLTVWPHWGAETGWWGEGRGSHRHSGIDLDGATGDPIEAAGAGRVMATGVLADYGGYGLVVLIDHGAIQTLYAHLSSIDVSIGDSVAGGQLIGRMGTTGNVTGSHLHFEVRMDGVPVDPHDHLPDRRPRR